MQNLFKLVTILVFFLMQYNVFSQSINNKNDNLLVKSLTFLASDSLKGRYPGTPECKVAAEYIKSNFKKFGLKSFYPNYFQKFKVTTNVKFGEKNSLSFNDTIYKINKDFIPLSFSASKTLNSEIEFVGFGFEINTDSLKWNSYENIDVNGKWVLMLVADPDLDNLHSKFIKYENERTKVILAKEKGAKGVIFVQGYDFDKNDKLMTDFYDNSALNYGIPVINISKNLANIIFNQDGKDFKKIEKQIIETKKPNSFALNKKINITTDVQPNVVTTQNVVAYLEGSDKKLKNEYILIGAHYDHLGFGGKNTTSRMPDTIAIHNGADDNASGVASILELAKELSNNKNNIKRSIIFVSFSAEEMGLLGSDYFVKNLPIKKDQLKAMINIDMLGRFNKDTKALEIGGVGSAKKIMKILNSVSHKDFNIVATQDGNGPSDQSSFYSSGYPVLYFTTGAHLDYHTPFDKVDKIDFKSQRMLLSYIYNVTMSIDNLDTNLIFVKSNTNHLHRHGRRLKITFGIIPNYSGSANDGLLVDGIIKGGRADNAGMLKGDKIVAINSEKVTNIYDYMYRLMKLEKGKVALVDVIRDGKKKVLLVYL